MGVFDKTKFQDQLQDPKYNLFAQKPVKKTVKDPNDEIRQKFAFENGILMLLGKEFGGKAAGFDVKFEGKKFRPSQINNPFLKDIKDQLEGKQAKVCEISFHGKYLCDVDESMRPEQVSVIVQMAIYNRIKKEGSL